LLRIAPHLLDVLLEEPECQALVQLDLAAVPSVNKEDRHGKRRRGLYSLGLQCAVPVQRVVDDAQHV